MRGDSRIECHLVEVVGYGLDGFVQDAVLLFGRFGVGYGRV